MATSNSWVYVERVLTGDFVAVEQCMWLPGAHVRIAWPLIAGGLRRLAKMARLGHMMWDGDSHLSIRGIVDDDPTFRDRGRGFRLLLRSTGTLRAEGVLARGMCTFYATEDEDYHPVEELRVSC